MKRIITNATELLEKLEQVDKNERPPRFRWSEVNKKKVKKHIHSKMKKPKHFRYVDVNDNHARLLNFTQEAIKAFDFDKFVCDHSEEQMNRLTERGKLIVFKKTTKQVYLEVKKNKKKRRRNKERERHVEEPSNKKRKVDNGT